MELNNLIPDRFRPLYNPTWIVKGNFLYFKKLELIPICFIKDDVVYIFLDARISKQVIKLTEHLIYLKADFYFLTPEASNPSGVIDFEEKVIKSYLMSYAKKEFFNGFKSIEFDLISNMVKWTEKENCFSLIKEIYQDVLKEINHQTWDYYSNKKHYDYCQDIREEFQSLYRAIQISKII